MATLQFTSMPTNRGVPTTTVVPDLLFGDFTQSEVESIIKQSVKQQDSEAAPLSFGSFSCEEVSQLVTSSHGLKDVVDFEFESENQNGSLDIDSIDLAVSPGAVTQNDQYHSAPKEEQDEEVRLPVITSSVIGEVSHIPSPIFPSLNLSADPGNPILSTPEKADINDVMHRLIEEAVKSSNFVQTPENNFAAAAPAPWSTQPDMSWSDNRKFGDEFFNPTPSTGQEQQPWITTKKPAAPSASVWSNNHHPWTSMFKDTSQPEPQQQSTQNSVPQPKLPQILSETRPIVSSKDHELMMLGSQLQLMTITHSETVPLIPRGLINKSTNCFAHAPLQALLVSPLYHVIRQLNPNYTVSPVLCAVKSFFDGYRLMSGIYANFDSPFEPTSIYEMLRSKIPSFNENGRQEDAEEFLGIILSNLHDEMVSAIRSAKKTVSLPLIVEPQEEDGGEWQQIGKKKRIQVTRNTSNNETSPVSELFGGLTRSVVTKAGAKESATLQPFLSLQLDIQNPSISTVEDALLNFTHREQITLNEVKCYRRETLESLPPVLILHLKRFIYDEAAKSCQKLHKDIDFGVQMTIQNEMLSPAVACGGREYRLFGVVYHHGSHAAGGHYTAMTYHQSLMSWIYHDDEKVQTQYDKAVLKHIPGRSAYLLFYKRIN